MSIQIIDIQFRLQFEKTKSNVALKQFIFFFKTLTVDVCME